MSVLSRARATTVMYVKSARAFLRDFRYEIAAFLVSATVFSLVYHLGLAGDHIAYLQIIVRVLNGERLPPLNFLYYFTVCAFAFFTTQWSLLVTSQIVVLALSVALKVLITKKIIYEFAAMRGKEIGQPDRIPLFAFLLALAFSLPSTKIPYRIRGVLGRHQMAEERRRGRHRCFGFRVGFGDDRIPVHL